MLSGPLARFKGLVSSILIVSALLGTAIACEEPARPRVEAEIGVFYGGQVQRLERIFSSAVQAPNWGFRITVTNPTGAPPVAREFSYQVVRPGPSGRRVSETGTLELPPGQTRIDQILGRGQEMRHGLWNIRIVHEHKLIADQAVVLAAPP
jgi:hypothetical protein